MWCDLHDRQYSTAECPDCKRAVKILGQHQVTDRIVDDVNHFTTSTKKPSNPKDALGILKVPMSTVSAPVLAELGVAMLEGAMKYGRHNYRVIGVRASVYYDAVMARHMPAWWEGEDEDPDSGLSHITKAIASLVVLRDAMIQGKCIDDRPPPSPKGWLTALNGKVKALLEKYPNPVKPYTAKSEE
jgi:hypothetical protein